MILQALSYYIYMCVGGGIPFGSDPSLRNLIKYGWQSISLVCPQGKKTKQT